MLKAVSSSNGLQLSRAWEVAKAHKGAYSGGKVELSSDGSFLACLYDADVSFVDVEEGVVTKRLTKEGGPGTEEEILTFVLHPSKREIVTASRSQLLRHWDIETGDCKRAIRAHDHIVLCMDYDGTGTLVGTGGSDHTVKIWDIERGYCTHNFRGHTGIVSVLAFHPDPKRLVLVSGSEDTTVRVWDLSKQSCTAVLKAHLSYVTSLAFLSGGAGFVTGGRDRVLNVWDLNCSSPIKTFPVYEAVEGLQVLPTSTEFSERYPTCSRGDLVAVAGKNGVVRVFSFEGQADAEAVAKTAPGKSKSAKKNKKNAEDSSATPTPEAVKAEEGSSMAPVSLPTKFSCRCVMTQDTRTAVHKAGYMALVLDRRRGGLIAVTADHNLLLLEPAPSSAGGGGGSGNKDSGAAKTRGDVLVTKRQIVGYNDEVIDIKSLPSGGVSGSGDGESWVAVATNSPQVRLFELGGFSCRLLDGHTDTVLALDVAPDGRHLCTSSKDRTCLLWDLDLGYPVVRWTGHSDAVGAIAASHKPGPWTPPPTTSKNSASSFLNSVSGAFVVSGAADRTLQRWEVPSRALSGFVEKRKRSPSASAVTSTPIGSNEAGGLGFEEGKEELSAPLLETAARSVRAHEKDINCVAVSPNDAVVASASQDRTVRLWRSKDLEPMGVLTGHKRGVWKVEFSPVDRCVATCSGDRTVKVWSIADCLCLRTFQGHTASVLSVTFVSAGAQLVSGGADGLLKLWTLRSDECEATLDAHTDKVWALTTAVAPGKGRDRMGFQGDEEGAMEGEDAEADRRGPNAGIVVVSGGADSVVNVWQDVTAREEEKTIAEKEAALLKEQELSNRLRAKDYGPAIALALELRRPHRLWGVLRDAMTDGMGGDASGFDGIGGNEAATEMSSRKLDKHVALWSMETIAQCLGYCRDWNTNAKKAIVVHAVLGSILRCVGIASLKEIPDCAELVRSLLPYSERHFQRLDRLLQSSYLVEYTLTSMQLLISESSDSPRTAARGRRLLEEEKRVFGEGQGVKGIHTNVSMGDGAGGDDDIDSGSESEEGRGRGRSTAVAVSEVVDGRVVFNVRPVEAVDGAGDAESSDSDEDAAGDGTETSVLSSEVLEGGVIGEKGHEANASSGVRKSRKNERKKQHGDGEGKSQGIVAPVGLLRQPVVTNGSKLVLASSGGVDGLGGEVATTDSGQKKRKKPKKSASSNVGADTVGDSAEGREPEETPTEVLEGRRKQGNGVEVGGDSGKAGKTDGVLEVEGEAATEESGKKKRKKRRKSASSTVGAHTAVDSADSCELKGVSTEVLEGKGGGVEVEGVPGKTEGSSEVMDVDGEAATAGSGKKGRKKKRTKSMSPTMSAGTAADSTETRERNETPTEVLEGQGSNVEVERASVKAEGSSRVMDIEGEAATAGSGKKGRKEKRTKSTSSTASVGTAADSTETREREETPTKVLEERRKQGSDVEVDRDSAKAEKTSGTAGRKRGSGKRRRREDET